ncbi:Tetratricopeptide repeat-containing protein [Lentzea waywayandensis]|uniref:Tetratricopeptide repeat-containing protein n=1 Tax=Lentzea waywayandensis TaxID=84724 RepID=A0A1I6F5B0_9PSEU|nr:Tetratricopeptide repeat-containing protein [Lentzea waywayandensis]
MHNSVTGDVYGPLVQAGHVSGDINLHTHTTLRPPAELPLRIGVVPQRAASFQQRSLSWNAVTVLSGMGGVGKTQLAADHAAKEWSAGKVSLLVWVTADSREAIVSAYAEAAAELTGRDETDPERGARRLLEWLASTGEPWLVVLDDVQDPADLADLWPPDNGRTLVTTRRRDAALRGDRRAVVEVETFSEAEGLAYLREVLADQPALLDGAAEVVRELGCLPLALAQAGAYVLDLQLSCTEYLRRLTSQPLKSVAATWSLSIQQANSLRPRKVAGHLLDVLSVLDPNGVPLGVLLGASTQDHVLGRTGDVLDESGLRDVLANLHRLGLITLDPTSPGREIRVHALVQRANRDTWKTRQTRRVTRAAADALKEVWPRNPHDQSVNVLRANAATLFANGSEHLWGRKCHALPLTLGNSIGLSGRADEARDHFDRLRTTATQALGPCDVYTLVARSSLAYWRGRAGDPAGALAEYEQISADASRVRRADREVVRDLVLNNLQDHANMRARTGDVAGAVTQFEQLLSERLRTHGPDDLDVLSIRNDLARLRRRSGSGDPLAEIERLIPDLSRVYGPEHPQTLAARHNLAVARAGSGDLAGAIADQERLVPDALRVYGPGHPRTVDIRNSLVDWLAEAGDLEGARAAAAELVADHERLLGADLKRRRED